LLKVVHDESGETTEEILSRCGAVYKQTLRARLKCVTWFTVKSVSFK